ncbi:unnamed protein product [Paramecium primaurelia]|uniref:Uncharacterized protein n=1 Tax=Paramecium primaurelia TaxID=5886 RepID=A0A8S1PQ41_PARPR|nr:unnamed protein product [Paramecium primaurelia]
MDAVGYNINKINELLLINRYYGKWESLTNNPFNYLEQKKGETFLQFKTDFYTQGHSQIKQVSF